MDDDAAKPEAANAFSSGRFSGDHGHNFRDKAAQADQTSQGAAFTPFFPDTQSSGAPWEEASGGDATPKPEQSDLQEIERRAFENAAAEGEKKGFETGMQQAREIIERLESILSSVETSWSKLVEIYETEIIQLVGRTAEKVVFGQVAVDQSTVKRAIMHAFEVIPHPVEVTLHVNPEDYEYIETIKDDFFSRFKKLKHMSVISDPATDSGGCKIITGSGEVDATLESRLAAVQQSIMEAGGIKGVDDAQA